MTITDINKILSRLADNPTRENILDFSFGLLQWMNIEPNAANKPQLLSPQTQKLKDFLATAPQTVQPQLYRISADNQNIRVRFAVLKKLKKEYISQLVDNDPGLGSYQSFSKGLIQQNGTSFIPTQPYFIHFVTTPDYDKLVLIFNQGEQKRIVSFRNRLTNTQYNKIIQLWQSIGTKPKPEIADLLWKSLDIKEVNKEFYKQIKERFDALLGIVKTQHSTATDNQVKQFTVRLIGRYIFCWFLKEKGIIPHSLISKEAIEKTENYYQNALLKLFFETLNTKVQDRNPLALNKLFEKIPYLNGGLFDESEEDKLFVKLKLDAWLLPFVEILESYDFTVDESSSQYQHVAVDPEMLGRIFENLLASQNEETEKLANQRKAFGAFYTPREIVDYMVNESIKAFLQTQWEQHFIEERTKHINNPEPVGDIFGNKKPQQLAIATKGYELKQEEKEKIEKALAPLFLSQPHPDGLKKEEKNLLLSFLEKIKILDPACGSGAFPMGILHKLVELNEVLGTVKSSYELKKDILSQNIYGVDIMPMAIEIARLRAWLSLVLEEDYKPNDPKHNFGVKPLPNLDFKFVCANSLIDLGLDAFIHETKNSLLAGFNEKLITQLKALEDLRKQFFTPALASTEKEKLKNEYLQKRNEVVANIEKESEPVLTAIAKKIKHWNPFDDSHPSTFFSPTWMFGIDKGFDVVIGNPPYISYYSGQAAKIDKELYTLYINSYHFIQNKKARNRVGTVMLFLERSLSILKNKGVNTFIIDLNIFSDAFIPIRKYLHDKIEINQIISNLSEFENVGSGQVIFSYKKQQANDNNFLYYKSFSDNKPQLIPQSKINLKSNYSFRFGSNDNIIEKIKQHCMPFNEAAHIISGMNIGGVKDYFLSDKKENDTYHKAVLSGNIFRYFTDYPNELQVRNPRNKYIRFDKSIEKHIWDNNIGTPSIGEDELKFRQPKILLRRPLTGDGVLAASYSEDNEEYSDVTVYIINETKLSLKYLLGIINSKLATYYCKETGIIRFEKGQQPQITINRFKEFPVKKDKDFFENIISLVEKILSLKKKNQDTTSLEKKIDVLVYKLYELTYDEVKIIDKDFWLSEEEYKKKIMVS